MWSSQSSSHSAIHQAAYSRGQRSSQSSSHSTIHQAAHSHGQWSSQSSIQPHIKQLAHAVTNRSFKKARKKQPGDHSDSNPIDHFVIQLIISQSGTYITIPPRIIRLIFRKQKYNKTNLRINANLWWGSSWISTTKTCPYVPFLHFRRIMFSSEFNTMEVQSAGPDTEIDIDN